MTNDNEDATAQLKNLVACLRLTRAVLGESSDLKRTEDSRLVISTVKRALSTLPPREAKVLWMRFGIDMPTGHTLEEVGKQFDVSSVRIRQIEAKALRKLRHYTRKPIWQMMHSAESA